MDCDFLRNIYLLSNGDINCGRDEPGYDLRVNIHSKSGEIDLSRWDKQYNAVAKRLSNNKIPFKQCINCKIFWPAAEIINTTTESSRIIRTLVVEPTVLCNISCTNCAPIKERKYLREKTNSGKLYLSEETFENTLTQLKERNITIDNIEFQGFGEPLVAKRLPELITKARDYFPESRLSLISNGISKSLNESVFKDLDYVIFSIDGVSQETYEPYRIMGDFYNAISNMNKVVEYKKNKEGFNYKVIWKYIIFRHNCSRENLQKAVELSDEISVDELRFIISDFGPISTKFHKFGNALNTKLFDNSLYCDQYESASLLSINKLADELNIDSPFSIELNDRENITMFNMIVHRSNLLFAVNIAKRDFECDPENSKLLIRYCLKVLERTYGYAGVNYAYILKEDMELLSEIYSLTILIFNEQETLEIFEQHNSLFMLSKLEILDNSNEISLKFISYRNVLRKNEVRFISENNDPSVLIFSEELKSLSGKCKVIINVNYFTKSIKDINPQLFYDTGYGFNEEESARVNIIDGEVTFNLDTNKIHRLRFDPLDSVGEFEILSINYIQLF